MSCPIDCAGCDRRSSRDERAHAAGSLLRMRLLENATDYSKNHVRGERGRSNRTRASSLHFSCCVRCRCARLTILLLLCDARRAAQANDYPDESTRLHMLRPSLSAYRGRLSAPRRMRASSPPHGLHSVVVAGGSVRSAPVWAYRGLYERVRRLAGARCGSA